MMLKTHKRKSMSSPSIPDFSESRSARINRILQPEQLHSILETLFINRPIKILRTIARTGKYAQSVPWVHWECEITGMRRATFISFQDLLDSFWVWWESASTFALALWEVSIIAKVIWSVLPVGSWVYHNNIGKAQIAAKDISRKTGKLRFWLRANDRAYVAYPIDILPPLN